MLKLNSLIIIFLILTSCNNEKNNKEVKKGTPQEYKEVFSFQPTKLVKIKIDEFTPYRTFNSQLIDADTNNPMLVWENAPLNALEFYSLKDENLLKELESKKMGQMELTGRLEDSNILEKIQF